jgi:hypothetical protein
VKVLGHKKVEGCLEGTNVYDIFLKENIDENFITFLSNFGKLIQNNEIENPFFKIIVKGKYTIKGSIGNKSVRILLPDSNYNELLTELIELLEC